MPSASSRIRADVSTANCNAFYELGVRHALRPATTIIIAEDKFKFPFIWLYLHDVDENVDETEIPEFEITGGCGDYCITCSVEG